MKEIDLAIAGFYHNDCDCGCGCTGPAGPMGPQGPQGPAGPAGASATSQNAMRYQAGTQTVGAGGVLSMSTSVIHSVGAISASGASGLTLTPGQYLLGFTADAALADTGELGAVLALNGVPLAYTASLLTSSASHTVSIALSSILNLNAAGTVTVRNNADDANYTNPVLTVVKLA